MAAMPLSEQLNIAVHGIADDITEITDDIFERMRNNEFKFNKSSKDAKAEIRRLRLKEVCVLVVLCFLRHR